MAACRHARLTPRVSVILLWAPALLEPYPLIPDGNYAICRDCDAAFAFIAKAQAAHAECSKAGDWTRAVVVFNDGSGLDIRAKRKEASA